MMVKFLNFSFNPVTHLNNRLDVLIVGYPRISLVYIKIQFWPCGLGEDFTI